MVWRKFEQPKQYYTLDKNDVDQIFARYNNAKALAAQYKQDENPEYKFEYGKAYALECVLAMLGFDYEEIRKEHWVDGD